MSVNLLERLKEFLVRLVKDQAFRNQLDNSTVEERQQALKEAGYVFSKEEFETAALDLLESKEQGEFTDLNEEELAGVLGGFVGGKYPIIQPMYGVIVWPPKDWLPQPMYGVIVSSDQ
ncbi:Nif11-like leader peptide family RiPP precursor [Microseira sp. BLCC-F43]|jgi:predicted ribosomally synthesized peptide with nif11-like leader|uniref:Nif11-like leader peptide family RiPP precursor n=1 Tax=Microseira sp. BLCC-F43 TaxID=3153602 RepID=UPI0035B9BCBD